MARAALMNSILVALLLLTGWVYHFSSSYTAKISISHPSIRTIKNVSLDPFRDEVDCGGRKYPDLKEEWMRNGYIIFKSCTMRSESLASAAAFTKSILPSIRLQDANVEVVRQLALDPDVLKILEYVKGSTPFPFQTLNFLVGTSQPVHSDVVHFDSLPKRGLMSAAWIAFEDIQPGSGPLEFYPGSHRFGMWDYLELNLYNDVGHMNPHDTGGTSQYGLFEQVLQTKIKANGLKAHFADNLKMGDIFIWESSLLHGGSKVTNVSTTRLSQVTHYFFDGAEMFWVPRMSHPYEKPHYKKDMPPCVSQDLAVESCADMKIREFRARGGRAPQRRGEQRSRVMKKLNGGCIT